MDEENKRGLLFGLPLVLGIGAVLILSVIWWIDNSNGQRIATAPAEIVSATPTSWSENKTTKNGFRVSYRFDASGKSVTGVHEKNSWYKAGEPYRVCYNPKHPSDSELRSASGMDCGKRILF